MDENDFQDEYARAIQIGVDNQLILQLATAWCKHVGHTTGGVLGVGMIEQATGLPISGGSLRCEFAKAPTTFGMRLNDSSVEFYASNCVGCRHRKPTAATIHLGTYAEAVIAEREKKRAEAEQERLRREDARRQRQEARRLSFGIPDPAGQSLLDLIERVDGGERDKEAEELLLRHAEMSPADFPDDLLAHLTDEAVAIGNSALLESVIAVFERDARPDVNRMLPVAFRAIASGIAPAACGRVIAKHGEDFAVPDKAIGAIVHLAAGYSDYFGRQSEGEPAALLRLYDVDPGRAIRSVTAHLADAEALVRAATARASGRIIVARPSAALTLLPALLDATIIPDKSRYSGDPFAAEEARNVVADVLVAFPVPTADKINRRMKEADTRTLHRLWDCYDRAARGTLSDPDALPPEAGKAIGETAFALLSRSNLDPDLARDVADTLYLLCSHHPKGLTLSPHQLLGLLVAVVERYYQLESAPVSAAATSGYEAAVVTGLERESQRLSVHGVVTELKQALAAAAKHQSALFVDMVIGYGWTLTASWPLARSTLVEVLGETLREQVGLDRVASFLQSAVNSRDNRERAEAIEALGVIASHGLILPSGCAEAILGAIDDKFLIVVLAAVRAIAQIDVPAENRLKIAMSLISFAAAYGPKRIHSHDVRLALSTAWQLSVAQRFESAAHHLILQVIAGLPSTEAVEVLDRFRVAEKHAEWPATAIAALRPDPDPQWYGIHDAERFNILRKLAALPTVVLSPFFDTLAAIGKQQIPDKASWAWAVSDVLAAHGEYAHAAGLCDALVDSIPDTREFEPRRRYARVIAINHHLNTAIAGGERADRDRLMREWAELFAEMESE